MSRENTRIEVTKLVNAAVAAWSAYTLVVDWENRGFVDYAAQVNPYVAIDIAYQGGIPLELAARPRARIFGDIQISVCVREGAGTAGANALMDHITSYLQLAFVLYFQTNVAAPQPSRPVKGWYCLVTFIPFWYHEAT